MKDSELDWEILSQEFVRIQALEKAIQEIELQKIQTTKPEMAAEIHSLLMADPSLAEDAQSYVQKSLAQLTIAKDSTLAPNRIPINSVIDDFRILELLGVGAFAYVYRAWQESLGREVALKVSLDVGSEAQVLAKLEHDNIVGVFMEVPASYNQQSLRLIAMQLIKGKSLAEHFKKTTIKYKFEAVLSNIAELANALQYAHDHNILHLDVKPGNILLSEHGRAYLSDFNVSVASSAKQITGADILGGSKDYMSPEHIATTELTPDRRNEIRIDGRSDQYALAKLAQEWFSKIDRVDIPEEIKQKLFLILEKAMALRPEDRFSNAQSFSAALLNLLDDYKIAQKLPRLGPIGRFTSAMPILAVLLLIYVPQLLGSAFNISYNSIYIVQNLESSKAEAFAYLCFLYNIFVYPICLLLGIWVLKPFFQIGRQAKHGKYSPELQSTLRTNFSKYPKRLLTIVTLGWLPCLLFFPLGMQKLGYPFAAAEINHLLISISISWLISVAYLQLTVEFLLHRIYLPKLFGISDSIQEFSSRYLKTRSSTALLLRFGAGAMPLLAAALLLLNTPSSLASNISSLHALCLFLIAIGIGGFFLSVIAILQVNQTIYAFRKV